MVANQLREPEEQERMMTQSKQASDNLAEEQHLGSFGSKDPEENYESEFTIRKRRRN